MLPAAPDGLWAIEGPHFSCGLEVYEGIVSRPAPIVGYMAGWPLERVRRYCARRRWSLERVA
jgi:hypothetical protein